MSTTASNSSTAAKIIAKRSKSKVTKNTTTSYVIWIGGLCGVVILAICLMMFSPEKNPGDRYVNSDNLISHINSHSPSWTAGNVDAFNDWKLADVRHYQGVAVSKNGDSMQNCPVANVNVPLDFDSRVAFPQCFDYPILTQANCSSSWAMASVSALGNRYCIQDSEKYPNLQLSAQAALSCDGQNGGCTGGHLDSVWDFLESSGTVTESCFPYQANSAISCDARCKSETPLKAAGHCVLGGEDSIKREIFTRGPVVVPLFLSDDFLVYKSGIYSEMPTATRLTDSKRNRIIHAVKIIGWGQEDAKPFWIVENSFGPNWGMKGFGKILRTPTLFDNSGAPLKQNSVIIDTFVLSPTPANEKKGGNVYERAAAAASMPAGSTEYNSQYGEDVEMEEYQDE
jgi:cathepsin B